VTLEVAVSILGISIARQRPWSSCSHTRASVTGQQRTAAGKVIIGTASHWPCITDLSVLSTYGLTA